MLDDYNLDKKYREERLGSRKKITNLTGDATTKKKPITDKIECPNCHRTIMVPYTQPPGLTYKDGTPMNETGFVVGSKWLLCPLLECNHRIEIVKPQRQSKVELAHGKEAQGKLFIQTIGKKKKGGLTADDRELASWFGGSGEGMTKVDSHEYTYSSESGWTES